MWCSAAVATYLLWGSCLTRFFSICSSRHLLLKSVLVYVDFISYVSVFCMFVVFDMGRRMISPGPGEGAHLCLGEGILLFWLAKVSWLHVFATLFQYYTGCSVVLFW